MKRITWRDASTRSHAFEEGSKVSKCGPVRRNETRPSTQRCARCLEALQGLDEGSALYMAELERELFGPFNSLNALGGGKTIKTGRDPKKLKEAT